MNYELNLPPVSDMMRAAGMEPRKQLGQNFLFDLNLTKKIARNVPDISNATVIEVGPGPGGLTRALLECGAKKVIAIEKDHRAEPILTQIADAANGRLEIVFGDAMKTDYDNLVHGDYAICSNLPYNIGTELLIRWLHLIYEGARSKEQGIRRVVPAETIVSTGRAPAFSLFLFPSSLTLMFQREVAERIVARTGDKQYGRLSVLTALVADSKILFDVPNTAFVPIPKVQSAVVQIIPKKNSILDSRFLSLEKVERISAKLFGNRRKMIRGIIPGIDWAQWGLTGAERAEELSPEKFVELSAGIKLD